MTAGKSKDPKVRQAACMVRALKACCPVPRALPGLPVLRLAALELGLDLPKVLRSRDARRLAAAGLTREYTAALLRAFPDTQAADALAAGAEALMAGLAPGLVGDAVRSWGTAAPERLARDPYGAVHELKGTLEQADEVAGAAFRPRVAGHVRWHLLSARRDGHTMLPTTALLAKLRSRFAEDVDELRQALGTAKADAIVRKGMQGRGGFWVREECPDGVVRETGSRTC